MKIFWTKVFRFLDFLILKDFSRNFTSWSRSWCSFISLFTLDLESFSFHFSFSKWVKLTFILIFSSWNEWTRFSFHSSLLKLPIFTLAGHWCRQVKRYDSEVRMDRRGQAQITFHNLIMALNRAAEEFASTLTNLLHCVLHSAVHCIESCFCRKVL